MMNFVPYIIKLSISLSIVYLFYQFCLRRLTFYNWNRWFLVLYSMICFVIPFIRIDAAPEQSIIVQYIPAISDKDLTNHANTYDFTQLYFIVVVTGIILFGIRLLVQCISLINMRSKAKLLYNNDIKLYHIDKPVIPFSFGNSIYINQHQHSDQELSDIIKHEFIHVKQRHTADIIWSELLCIINWYNPFAWLLRKSIRQNLEFIADNQVLQSGFDRKQYQYLLLKVIGTPSYSIASNFNFSSLKKRIAMMNKAKSARVNLLRFAFILPLLSVMVLAFRTNNHPAVPPIDKAVVETVLAVPFKADLPADTTPKVTPVLIEKAIEKRKIPITGDQIASLTVLKENGQNRIIIELRNGEVDDFDFNNPADSKRFEEKYGGPAPVVAPKPLVAPAMNDKGYFISIADNNGECVVIVKNVKGEIVKAMSLTDWDKNKAANEQLYGPIPEPPVPPKPATPGSPIISIRPVKAAEPAAAPVPAKAGTPVLSIVPSPATAPAAPVAPVPVDTAQRVSAVNNNAFRQNFTNAVNRRSNAPGAGKPYTPVFDVLITPHTSRAELNKIAGVLQSHGHTLEIQDADYKDGMLTRFNALIVNKDGGRGSIRTQDLSKGSVNIIAMLDENGKEHFAVNVHSHPPVL